MISWAGALLVFLVAVWLGFQIGHGYANIENAEECRRLGGFYVRNSVFKCHEIVDNPKVASTDSIESIKWTGNGFR